MNAAGNDRHYDAAATAAFNEEVAAEGFLQRLRVRVYRTELHPAASANLYPLYTLPCSSMIHLHRHSSEHFREVCVAQHIGECAHCR